MKKTTAIVLVACALAVSSLLDLAVDGSPEALVRLLALAPLARGPQHDDQLAALLSDGLVEVASAVCGVHAQVQASAELQLAARVDRVAQTDVRSALWEERALVKARTIRGTLHLHPAGELPL